MIAEQRRNEAQMRKEDFWRRVNLIKGCHNDAVDFVDTVEALCKNGMTSKFEAWMKQQNVSYTIYDKKLKVRCLCDHKQDAHVYYAPAENAVCFGWNGYGMCEYFSTNMNTDYFIQRRLGSHGYDDGLTALATRLQPFLDNFFEWVDSL